MNRRRLKTCFLGGYEKESVLEYTQTLLQGYQWELIRLQRQLAAKDVMLEKEQTKLAELKLQISRKDILLQELRNENVKLAAERNKHRSSQKHPLSQQAGETAPPVVEKKARRSSAGLMALLEPQLRESERYE